MLIKNSFRSARTLFLDIKKPVEKLIPTGFKEVRFINLQGEVVFQSTFSTQINVSELPSALYIIEFIDNADNLTIQKIFIE